MSGQADCNTFTGTYTTEGGFFITAQPDVMAACGGDSLDNQYFELLDAIVAGGSDGAGGLALETDGGEQRMAFVMVADDRSLPVLEASHAQRQGRRSLRY